MEEDELKKAIINNYNECYDENASIDENINNYVASLYYDLLDDIDINRKTFDVPKELTDIEAVHYIEELIENTLKGDLENEK